MSLEARATRGPTFQRFFPQTSPVFQERANRINRCLNARLLQPHLEFATSRRGNRGRDWRKFANSVMLLDFEGITRARDFSEIMREIDSKTEGRILDEARSMLRELHKEIKKEELPAGFSLAGFFKEPKVPTAEENYNGTPNFEPAEIFLRTFGVVDNIIDLGKKYPLPDKYWKRLEQRFIIGYTFLRAAEILSRKI